MFVFDHWSLYFYGYVSFANISIFVSLKTLRVLKSYWVVPKVEPSKTLNRTFKDLQGAFKTMIGSLCTHVLFFGIHGI